MMSLLLHHLVTDSKVAVLREACRVMRPGARLHVADWGRPGSLVPRLGFSALRLLDGLENTRDHAHGRLPELILVAGLDEPVLRRRIGTVWGTLEVFAARKPGA